MAERLRAWPLAGPARPAAAAPAEPGAVHGGVRWLLRAEGLALLAFAVAAYAQWAVPQGAGWGRFALLFLLPDAAFLAYLAGPRAGALAYNATHSLAGPVLAGLAALALPSAAWGAVALVWLAHIGFDRALGYGLKYAQGFGFTHLGRLGPRDPW